MTDNTVPIQGRNITLLQYPPRRPGQTDEFLDGFKWVHQYLYVDQIPEHSREFDTPYRIRLYDQKPQKNNLKQFQAYRTSLSVGEDLQISVFPSLEAMFTAMIEWRPAPKPNSEVMKSTGSLALALSTRGRRWIFSVPEAELLELLDLFRSIAPTTCASADRATREKDGLIEQLPVAGASNSNYAPKSISTRPRGSSTGGSSSQIEIDPTAIVSADSFLTTPTSTKRIMDQNFDESFCSVVEPLAPNVEPPVFKIIDNTAQKFQTSISPPSGKPTKDSKSKPSKGPSLPPAMEVDNPTAGLNDAMFADHFTIDTPAVKPSSSHNRRPSGFLTSPAPHASNFNTLPATPSLHSPNQQHDSHTHAPNNPNNDQAANRPQTPSQLSTVTDSDSTLQPLVVTNTDGDDLVFESGNQGIVVHTTSSSLIANNTIKSFQKVFNLPDDELLFSCTCSFLKSILLQGRIYVSDKHLCFYSSIFGYRTKLTIPLTDIQRAESTTLAGVFGGGLKISISTDSSPLIFGSLRDQNKNRLVATLERVGEHINPHLREKVEEKSNNNSGTASTSSNDSNRDRSGDGGDSSDDDDEAGKDDEEEEEEEEESETNSVIEEPCNLPLYDTLNFPSGPPPPNPAVFAAIHAEFETVLNTTVNCSFSQLWDGFLKNTAHKAFVDFYEVRKEQSIRMSQWTVFQPDSEKALDPSNPMLGASELLIRQISFNSELKAPMGPPRVDIYKRQVCAIFKGSDGNVNKLVLLAINSTPDAPFGKEFFVCEQFTFVPAASKGKLDVSLKLSAWFPKAVGWGLKMILGTLKSRVKSDGTGQHEEWLKWVNLQIALPEFQNHITDKYTPKPSFSISLVSAKKKSKSKSKSKSSKKQSKADTLVQVALSLPPPPPISQSVSAAPLPSFAPFGIPASQLVAGLCSIIISLATLLKGEVGFDQGIKLSILIALIFILSCLERGNAQQ